MKRKKPAPRRRLLRFARTKAYFLPFFAAFLRAPPFFAAFFAPPFFAPPRFAAFLAPPFFAAFLPAFFAAMLISSDGVKRPIEPPVVRTSQWLDAEAPFPPRHESHGETVTSCAADYMATLKVVKPKVLIEITEREKSKFFTAPVILAVFSGKVAARQCAISSGAMAVMKAPPMVGGAAAE